MQARDGRDREGDRRHSEKLGDPEFRRRLEENKLRVKGAGVDLKSAEQDSKEVAMKAREAAKAKRVSKGKGLFDDSAVDDMSRQAASQPLLPQKATGMWNLDGKTNSEMGGHLSKERLASELEARGIAVKRQGQHTKHGGDIAASPTSVSHGSPWRKLYTFDDLSTPSSSVSFGAMALPLLDSRSLCLSAATFSLGWNAPACFVCCPWRFTAILRASSSLASLSLPP